jgi:hypothetical protein
MRLSCGCVYSLITAGEDVHPAQQAHFDPCTGRKLLAGEYWCWTEHGRPRLAYREIVEWVDRVVEEHPPDAQDPDEAWVTPEQWQRIRDPDVHLSAIWGVRLICGHFGTVRTDVRWAPEDGQLFASERVAAFRRAVKLAWASDEFLGAPDDGSTRAHISRLDALDWPWPEPELECRACVFVRRINGYRRVNTRVRRASEPPKTQSTRRQLVAQLSGRAADLEAPTDARRTE